MKSPLFVIYSILIIAFAGHSLALNSWNLLQLQLPQYHVNPLFLSGTLLLYDRPLFFENRILEVKIENQEKPIQLDYNLETFGYNSYLQRRLYRMSTNETRCGMQRQVAFDHIFCDSRLKILENLNVEKITLRFTSILQNGRERTYVHECKHNE